MMPLLPLALAAVALVAMLLALRSFFFGYPPGRSDTLVLNRREQAVVAAAADALFPKGGPIPLSGTEAGLVEYIDDNLANIQRSTRFLIRLLLVLIELGPLVFGPRLARFTRLAPSERVESLRTMQISRLYFRRIAFLSIRALLSMGYLANDRVAAKIGMVSCKAPFEKRASNRHASASSFASVSP